MRKRYFKLTLFCFLATSLLGQTSPLEIIKERTMNSNTYEYSDGRREAIIAGGPINYKHKNSWKPINQEIVSSSETNYGFENITNVFQTFFPLKSSSSSNIEIKTINGDQLIINSNKAEVTFDQTEGLSIINSNTNVVSGIKHHNTLVYPNIYQGISDVYEILNAELKNTVILNNEPTILSNSSVDYYGFQENITLPENWSIKSNLISNSNLIESDLIILNELGEHQFTIPSPIVYDSIGAFDGSQEIKGKFLLNQNNNSWMLTTLVPTEWLISANRKYPVSIDPTITRPGNTGGWLSPVLHLNSTSYAFIGVCCGNEEHRAWTQFDISSIPNTACITNVEYQANVSHVGGTGSELVYVNDVTGTYGDYTGTNPVVYNDLGNGVYTSFSITITGTYGYMDLGPNADADLQGRLASGRFQVALMFDNEPSVNWKRINATQSSLRVTYDGVPCTVLPVELLDFSASCNNSETVISWTTMSEINNDYFTIEKSKDAVEFSPIATVVGSGNSNAKVKYSYIDENVNSDVVYYRLKQTDFDGTVNYHKTIAINCKDNKIRIYPNPTSDYIYIDPISSKNVSIELYNYLGKLVSIYDSSESNKLKLPETKGLYFLKVITGRYTYTERVIKH